MKYIKDFETTNAYETWAASSGYVTPNVVLCEDNMNVQYNPLSSHDYSQDYLTFVALSSGNIIFSGSSSGSVTNQLSYSKDGGSTWSTPSENSITRVSEGDTVLWKGECTPLSGTGIGIFRDTSNLAQYNVYGNVMSLLYGDNFIGQTDLSGKLHAFNSLFAYDGRVVSAANLVLPATTLSEACYYQMFRNCTRLTEAPQLLATTLAQDCCQKMFSGCTSLTEAPQLPATTLSDRCYAYMFYGCTNLTKAPELPATTLASSCYQGMFSGCTSLTKAIELPATTLSNNCYQSMFRGCTSLTEAPQLPATTLVASCYASMFSNCTSLSAITCLATDISASSCISSWLNGVAANGTFTKAASMTSWPTGIRGIPSGWTVQDYQEEA